MSQTSAQLLADSLGTASTGTVPIGGIIIWSGSVASIPDGYALCNGSNGTPNLRNKFILGAYSDTVSVAYPNVPPNNTGGSADATLVSHSHNFNVGGSTRSSASVTTSVSERDETADEKGGEPTQVLEEVTANNSNISIVANGSSATNANIPPYYSLAYIMRIS
tara:strand:+ start:35 stop:526 length:492 start_codon:yes stop_codon:yes gene_type:complete